MNHREARETIGKHDPDRALRSDAVDPLPLPPPPCTCPVEDKIEVSTLHDHEPRYLCAGRCRHA